MSEELGKAHVKITADTTDLNAKVDAAKAKVGSFAGSAKADTDALFESMKKGGTEAADAVNTAEGAVGGLATGLSALASFGATAVLAVITKIGFAIYEAQERAREANREMLRSVHELENAADKTRQTLEEMAEPSSAMANEIGKATQIVADMEAKIYERMNDKKNPLSKAKRAELMAEIDSLETELQETQKKIADRYSEEGGRKLRKQFQQRAADAVEADEKMYADFAKNAQKLADEEDKDREKQRKHAEEMQKAAERLNTTRLQGILDQEKALQRMYEAQARGFTSGDGSSSIQGGFDMLAREIQAGFSRMGNGA